MAISRKKQFFGGGWLLTLILLTSCIPGCDRGTLVIFNNCTKDTLFIGASQYDNIDSVDSQLLPDYNKLANSSLDTTGVSIWKNIEKNYGKGYIHIKFWKDSFILPDSMCTIKENHLFYDNDTCYFFLIKWKDAKNYSWDYIRSKKLKGSWGQVFDSLTIKEKMSRFLRETNESCQCRVPNP